MTTIRHTPLGPGSSWKTGQRVPETGLYVDQYGVASRFEAGTTFPPTVGFRGDSECAYRKLVDQAEPEAA